MGKVGLEVSETGRRERQRMRRWKEDGAEPHVLEKLQITRGLTAEKQISIVIDLGIQLTNIITVVCFLYGLIGVRNYRNRCTSIAQALTIAPSMCI